MNRKKYRKKKYSFQKDKPSSTSSGSIPILNNVLILILFIIVVFKLKDINSGYKWMHETLIGANLKIIKKYKALSFRQKQEAKLGFNVRFLNHLADNTPDTAIILMPPDTIILPLQGKSDFDKYMKNKTWVSYFLYPRKVVYEREKETSHLYSTATHIAIMNEWGYHKLPYNVKNKAKHSILELKK